MMIEGIKRCNHGNSAFVVCDGIQNPPVCFKRIYICLQACKEGFKNGCRPIIGVDGCHLKGPYSGMCLVAVSKDGNNHIFPVAWAVVEVENTETWSWFLELLSHDIGKEDGRGLTIMSDRQKGLVEALARVVPKAEIRYCVRHIWANFKLSFSGMAYKEMFWKAANTTSKAEFELQMEEIKQLSEDAYKHLHAIPPRHWSRHTFDTNCKSDMVVNNHCETFNSVLKDARDKPIFTHMEWMRRYAMERMSIKREGIQATQGTLMPFAKKYIKWAQDESRHCRIHKSSKGVYEVDYKQKRAVVNLANRTCTCNKWNLSGLPCQHAAKCILAQREDVENYVDEAYSKAKFEAAYAPAIEPMPESHDWDTTDLPRPLPPWIRSFPGGLQVRKGGRRQMRLLRRM